MPTARKLLLALGATAAVLGAGAAPSMAIVGGDDVPAGEYTNVAEVTFGFFGCSGTLIAPQWVLTAGHCGSITGGVATGTPAAWPPQAYTVRLGSNKAGKGTAYTVSQVTPEPDYFLKTGYDITLLKLTAPVTAVAATPVAGPGDKSLWTPATLEKIVGWGVTDEAGNNTPSTLQQAEVPIVTDASCATAYANQQDSDTFWSGFDDKTMICAGYPEGGVDTCQGDSGGPMFGALPTTGELRVVGATSYGQGCAEPGYPGIYARVGDDLLRNWIASLAPDAVKD